MIEQWKWVDGYENMYKISNLGNLRSFRKVEKGKALIPQVSNSGYLQIILKTPCYKPRSLLVHRLVAEAFISNENGLSEVNHIDEVKSNNSVENLEWCTKQYNMEFSLSKAYTFLSPDNEIVKLFNLSKFCREKGLNKGHMWNVNNGGALQHKGWRRTDENSVRCRS